MSNQSKAIQYQYRYFVRKLDLTYLNVNGCPFVIIKQSFLNEEMTAEEIQAAYGTREEAIEALPAFKRIWLPSAIRSWTLP